MAFTPVLRFAVISDLHYDESGECPLVRGKFRRAMDVIYKYAEGENYPALDALYLLGDVTNRGHDGEFLMLKEDTDAYVRRETALVVTLANHDLHYVPDYRVPMQTFSGTFRMPFDQHRVFKGYHFISLSGIRDAGPWDDSFNAEKRAFLSSELEKASADTPDKPIFVLQHVGLPGTVGGGIYGNDDLRPILDRYPRVVDFSGHSHHSVSDPAEFWQGTFTAVSTGALLNIHRPKNGIPFTPEEKAEAKERAHCLVVEADAGGTVRIRRLDVMAGTFFDDIIIPPSPPPFTPKA